MTYFNRIAVLAVLALGVLIFAPAPSAQAAVGWSVGTQFTVGPLAFDLFFQAGRPDHYFYRTRHSLHYRGVGCSDACYHRGGYAYHHASCPLVDFHFRRYGFQPYQVLGPIFYGPGYRYPHYRPHGPGYRSYPPSYQYRGPWAYPGPRRYDWRRPGHSPYRDHHYRGPQHYRAPRPYDRDWDSDSDSDRRGHRGHFDHRRYDDRRRDDDRRPRGRDTRPRRYPN